MSTPPPGPSSPYGLGARELFGRGRLAVSTQSPRRIHRRGLWRFDDLNGQLRVGDDLSGTLFTAADRTAWGRKRLTGVACPGPGAGAGGFNLCSEAGGAVPRTPRAVQEAGHAFLLEPSPPVVQRLTRGAVPGRDLTDRRPTEHLADSPVAVLGQLLYIHGYLRKHPCLTTERKSTNVQPNVSTMSRAQTVKQLLSPHTDNPPLSSGRCRLCAYSVCGVWPDSAVRRLQPHHTTDASRCHSTAHAGAHRLADPGVAWHHVSGESCQYRYGRFLATEVGQPCGGHPAEDAQQQDDNGPQRHQRIAA